MTGAAEFFEELRREYLIEAPARLGELRKDLAAVAAGEADAAGSLKSRFHRLAGSGGSYGFPEISTAARAAEQWLLANPRPDAAGVSHLEAAIATLASIFDAAAVEVGLPTSAMPAAAAFDWRALLLGQAGGLIDGIDRLLQDARYTVERKPLGYSPGDIPVSRRPDLVVLASESAGEELTAVVAAWGLPGATRPGAVALVAPGGEIDPLSQPFASLDLVVEPDRVDPDLLRYARGLGRAATAPRSVLIVDPDLTATTALSSALAGTQVRSEVVANSAALREAFGREAWDAIVLESRLPDTTMPALIRWIRNQEGHRLTPILIVARQLTEDDQVHAIRAGADDALEKTVPPAFIAQAIRARIDRSRLIRTAAHRDDLTGLLNQEALTEELDRAIGLARRASESVSVLLFDVDHLRRVNEQYGHVTGDLVLIHTARTLAGAIRSSDLTARMGGEEFGALVRRCRADDAVRLAEKIRNAIAETPVGSGGDEIRVRVSGGVAAYPDHGASGAEILRAAEKALTQAKGAGRDRVVAAS